MTPKRTKTRPEYRGYTCSQCGDAMGTTCVETDRGVYCSLRCFQQCPDDNDTREDEMKKTTHGGARDNAGPKTLASQGKLAKSERVTVRFTPEQLIVLQREADALECSVAELVAQRALEYTVSLHKRSK